MIRLTPRLTRTDTPSPYTTHFRSSDYVTGGTLRDEFRRQIGQSLIRMVFQYWSFVHRASREFVLRTARRALQLPQSCIAVRCCSPESVLSSFHAVKCDQLWSGR